ncbi:ABC transporter substrate-binding protein [Pseudomonas sp. MBLB4136]|uniref:ABC transporter substrate-binding protein n=1 Tax=Pseudomonas sp. MBLB4136 TaxID=3451558 RepID=UPI003F753802
MTFPRSFCIAILLALAATSSQAQEIRAVTEDTSYSYLKAGRVAGPASAVVEATLQRAGLNDYSLALYPWARAYDMALQQPNVLIYLIARTSAREPQFKWVGEITRIDYHLYKLRARTDIQVRTLQDAQRYSIGVLRDDVRQKYLRTQGFSRLVVSAHNRDNFQKLLNEQIELVPMPEQDVAMLCKEARIDCAELEPVYTLDAISTGLYMAYSQATADETVTRTRAAFDSLKAEGQVGRLLSGRR